MIDLYHFIIDLLISLFFLMATAVMDHLFLIFAAVSESSSGEESCTGSCTYWEPPKSLQS